MADDKMAAAIRETLISPNEVDRNSESANVVDALFAISRAVNSLADAVGRLGNGNAATPMGAIEAYGLHMGQKMDHLSAAIAEIATAIEEKAS